MAGSRDREQRKHIRIPHSSSVLVFAEGGTFSGRAVNISRSGMQVIVHMPETYREIRSITFRLPSSNETLHVPCRLVRLDRGDRPGKESVLGVELNYQTEAQMLLIDSFIREMVQRELAGEDRSRESRLLPRSRCAITGVAIDRAGVEPIAIDNISTEGLLLRFTGKLRVGDEVTLEFRLPGDERRLSVRGRITYVIENDFQNASAAGIALRELPEVARARIRNFIVASASGAAMRSLHDRFSSRPLDHEFRIGGRQRIASLFQVLAEQRLTVNALFEGSLQIVELQVQGINPQEGSWSACGEAAGPEACAARAAGEAGRPPGAGPPGGDPPEGDPPQAGYFSFYLNRGSHYFKAEILGRREGLLALRLPSVLYRSEKRSYQRKSMPDREEVRLIFDLGEAGDLQLQGRLIDISRHGFLCEVPLTEELKKGLLEPAGGGPGEAGAAALHSGRLLRYALRETLGLSHRGEIRHLSQAPGEDGGQVLRIGVEAGVERERFACRRIPPSRWSRRRLYRRPLPPSFRQPLPSRLVRYANTKGQEIAAIVQFTREPPAGGPPLDCPVVILPPGYGRKKEALAPLAATLLANFRHRGRDLAVLRYDGINRPGESHNETRLPPRGYEMLHYRISQGMDDLRTTLRYLYDNPLFRPRQTVLISSSMSALDARKLLAQPGEERVHLWISLMGVASAQAVLSNILGGLDIVGNTRMGIPNGINGMLGYLVDMDTLARDLIENRYAYLTDARQDMARISIPVLWIYGTYDRWLVPEEIRDIMSIRAGAAREVVEIPTGHNLRSSEDALRTFMLISAYLFEHLHGRRIAPCEPDREMLLRLVSEERERLDTLRPLPAEDYWRAYLLGNERNSLGYDFYRDLTDFRDFLDLEVRLIRPEEGGRLADLGCGTGLLEERILEHLAARGGSPPGTRPLHLVAVDLVPEALERTRQKWERVIRAHPGLATHRLECLRMNLEPNRLLPVRRFLEDPWLGYGYLHKRVEGLNVDTLERIARSDLLEVHRLMHGDPLEGYPSDLPQRLAAELSPEDCQTILDFNRAARFLLGRLTQADLIVQPFTDAKVPLEPDRYRALSTADLRFDRLSFGVCNLDLHLRLPEAGFDKIIASLFISYLHNPDDLLEEFHRALKPGGFLLVSSMRPDSDISAIFTRYVEKMQRFDLADSQGGNRDRNLSAARAMLNEAAALFQLEEDGYFRFYTAEELASRVEACGFIRPEARHSLGDPPQAVIVTARKPLE